MPYNGGTKAVALKSAIVKNLPNSQGCTFKNPKNRSLGGASRKHRRPYTYFALLLFVHCYGLSCSIRQFPLPFPPIDTDFRFSGSTIFLDSISSSNIF